ncbi:MAG TPA: cytochrome c biogenesis protein CcdA, partial [Candidatus Methanomethylicus sp.]|nr:cytochrome c biogenesis protein CcdA [Candidatus Methanomethylicus sp.]
IIFIASPCILPLLSIVAIISLTVEGMLSRVALLAAYSAGLGIPFILIGAFSSLSGRLRRLVATEAAGRVELLIMALTLAWLIVAFARS